MKPILIIGLGNPLMGDDGVGSAVAERLAVDPRLPGGVEVLSGGTDLLHFVNEVEGRTRVLVMDAFLDPAAEPGTVCEIDPDSAAFDDRQDDVHHLSAISAVLLLRMAAQVPITLLGIAVGSVTPGAELSQSIAVRLPEIVNCVLLRASASPCPPSADECAVRPPNLVYRCYNHSECP